MVHKGKKDIISFSSTMLWDGRKKVTCLRHPRDLCEQTVSVQQLLLRRFFLLLGRLGQLRWFSPCLILSWFVLLSLEGLLFSEEETKEGWIWGRGGEGKLEGVERGN